MAQREASENSKNSEKVIVVVEDDEGIAELFEDELLRRGVGSLCFTNAEDFLSWIKVEGERTPEAVILDLGLPDLSGLQILRKLGDITSRIPILVISSWHDTEYRRECFRLGAAEFVAKPFDLEEVMLRLERLLTMRLERDIYSQDIVRIGSGFLHCQFKVLTDPLRGETSLSHMEAKLLRKLAQNRGHLVPRDILFAEVWRYGEGAVSRTLDVYVSRLRRILQQSLSRAPIIENMRGEGYRLLDSAEDSILE